MEVAGAVVPPGVQAPSVVVTPEHVDESPRFEFCERSPLRFAHVGRSVHRIRIPDVTIFGRDVEVAAHQDVRVRIAHRLEMRAQPAQPLELELVLLVVERPAVRHVHLATRMPPHVADTMRASSRTISSSGAKPTAGSSRPTLLRMATPFQRPSPWCTPSYPSAENVSDGKAESASFVSCMHRMSG